VASRHPRRSATGLAGGSAVQTAGAIIDARGVGETKSVYERQGLLIDSREATDLIESPATGN
jgi:hypothetical protein